MNVYYVTRHQGEDGWCPEYEFRSSRRAIGRLLYRGESRRARRGALRSHHGKPETDACPFILARVGDKTVSQLKRSRYGLAIIQVNEIFKKAVERDLAEAERQFEEMRRTYEKAPQ